MEAIGSDPSETDEATVAGEIRRCLVDGYILRGPIGQVARYEGIGRDARGLEARLCIRRAVGRSRLLRGIYLFAKNTLRQGG